ncbi:hypothetical protein PZE06_12435 [Robertmurraya sp. DFI.2.37]|uniref:hypothetical protein n=1 Tax=Robertmurraya sp. DFI.2.37 TaxID=3031819 RepID=UPI001CD9FB9B|nr:hypothetical protein [Robertmurraya sp. DFI.2.37]MDF1508978.1 hypothetical protein [Robertmurraya sp. DFI.2.37]
MSDINCIKHLRNNKGLPITKIQHTLNINWRTVKKYADEEQLPTTKISPKKGMMHDENWGEIVSDWLFEDSKLRRKERRTKKKLFQELQELGFKGSYRTLGYFVQDWNNTHHHEKEKGFELSQSILNP